MKRFLPVIALVLAGLSAVGCSDKYYFTFVNTSPEDCTVSITGPNGIKHELGTVEKDFGRQHLGVKVRKRDEDEPPVCITWHCGETQSAIALDKYTPQNIWIGVPEGEAVDSIAVSDKLGSVKHILKKAKMEDHPKEDRLWLHY